LLKLRKGEGWWDWTSGMSIPLKMTHSRTRRMRRPPPPVVRTWAASNVRGNEAKDFRAILEGFRGPGRWSPV
jgi:hypothetical protein